MQSTRQIEFVDYQAKCLTVFEDCFPCYDYRYIRLARYAAVAYLRLGSFRCASMPAQCR